VHTLWVWAAPREGAALAAAGAADPLDGRVALGVGKSAAAVALCRALAAHQPRRVIAVGVCGAHRDSGLGIGDAALVGRERFADEGVATPGGFLDLAAIGLADDAPLVADAAWTAAAAQRLGVAVVDGQTVSTCAGTDALAAERRARWGPGIETMEGAAIAMACHSHSVPWAQLRVVSNFTGDRDRAQWDLTRALEGLTIACARLLRGEP
jgi:futalosine hydrolase